MAMRGALAVWLLVPALLLAGAPRGLAAAPAMPTITLAGPPGVAPKLSRLILGTDHLGKVPLAQTHAVLNEAVRLGINAFDTAPIYTDDIELKLGAWLKTQPRKDLYVITKGGFPRDLGPGTYESRLKGTRQAIAADVLGEARGSRSRFDRPITVYLMHRDDADFRRYERVNRPQTPVATILEALSQPELRENYQLIGLSNWATPRVDETQRVAKARPELLRPVCNSPYFSLFEMGPVTIHSGGVQVTHADMMNRSFQPGVKLMTYSPLGGFSIARPGWSAAKARALAFKQSNDRYWGHVHDALFHDANARRYANAVAFTRRFNALHHTGYTLDQVLNAYVLAHPRTDFLIIGPRTVADLRRTVAALELARRFTTADLELLHSGRVERSMDAPVANTGSAVPTQSAQVVTVSPDPVAE